MHNRQLHRLVWNHHHLTGLGGQTDHGGGLTGVDLGNNDCHGKTLPAIDGC
jgi:hypothetical protein